MLGSKTLYHRLCSFTRATAVCPCIPNRIQRVPGVKGQTFLGKNIWSSIEIENSYFVEIGLLGGLLATITTEDEQVNEKIKLISYVK